MKLVIISILLFCLIFVLAIPMKSESDKLADLILQENSLEDSASKLRYNLYLEEKEIDRLSSRNRIDSVAALLGLKPNVIPTKITGSVK